MKTKSAPAPVKLSKKAEESLSEIADLRSQTPIMHWMLAHGILKAGLKAKAIAALFPDLTKDEVKVQLGKCVHALSIAYDRGLMDGTMVGVRGFSSGSVMASVHKTAIGQLMAESMEATIHAAQVAIANGELPRMLFIPDGDKEREHNLKLPDAQGYWKVDYRLTCAALGERKLSSADLLAKLMQTIAENKELAELPPVVNVVPMKKAA